MSTSLLYHAFGCRDYVYKSTKYEAGEVVFVVEMHKRLLKCPHCKSRDVIRKGKRKRRLQTVPIGGRRVWLEVEVPRLKCQQCSKLSWIHPPLPKPTEAIPEAWQDLLSDSVD